MNKPTKEFGSAGSYSDTKYMGNPSNIKDRQFASAGAPGYNGGDNISDDMPGPDVDLYMVPDFQGKSGQGDNQSTMRPIGSV